MSFSRRSVFLLSSTMTASSAGQSAVVLNWLGSKGAPLVVVHVPHLGMLAWLSP
jgi:hypothetical protein